MRRRAVLCIVAVAQVATALSAQAQPRPDLPLWEIGIGIAGRSTPDFPGADTQSNRLVAFPHVAYRGNLIEIGAEETFRLVPFRTDRLELAVSIDGAASVERRGDTLGGDLPDLDALAEVGPEIIWRAAEVPAVAGNRAPGRIELALQVRGVFSVDGGIVHEGYVLRPALRYRQNGALKPGSRIEATIGPLFASEGVHDFFYRVDPQPGRPGFDAGAGYLGTEATAAVRYPLGRRTRVFGGVGIGYLAGAANRDSPVFATDFNASAFVGLTVSIIQSRARALRDR